MQDYFTKIAIADAVTLALQTDLSLSHTSNPLDQTMEFSKTL
jgi:hypothetical protein